MVVSRHITGEWVHVVDDGMVDTDALPDEVRPTGHVRFEPVWPDIATSGEIAYTLTPVTALIAEGQLRDVQGREGVWLPGEVGGVTVRWRAVTHLEFRSTVIPYPTLIFDLDSDARLTALLRSTEPGEFPWVVDPRIEGLLNDAQQVLADAQGVLQDAQDVQAGIDTAFDDAVDAAQGHASVAEGHASDAAGSASSASSSASAAAGSESAAADSATAAQGSASDAAGSASAASTDAGAAASSASAASTSAGEASTSAQDAELWATSFGLAATSSTGAPGSNASVTVTGDGPEYGLSFAIPRGDKGETGPAGEVTQAHLDAAVAALVDNAPEALNTLDELAQALGSDPNFATTVSNEIGQRATHDELGTAVDGALSELRGGVDEGMDTLAKIATAIGGISTAWADISGKPSVFPPSSHSHVWAEVTGKPSSFPPATHSHAISDVSGLQAALDDTAADWADLSGKPTVFPPATHGHTITDVSGLQAELNTKADTTHVNARPAMWLWDGGSAWTPPAEANTGDNVLNLSSGEIHSITEA